MEEAPIEAPASGEWDLIVLGTGLTEALVAGAAAKAGKSVLVLDHEGQYGSEWASFGVQALHEWLAVGDAAVVAAEGAQGGAGASTDELPVHAAAACRRRLSGVSFAGPDAGAGAPASATRGFSVDLSGPKVVYCHGELIDVLLRSGAHAHLEFKAVELVALHSRAQLRPVPASRAEVFTSRDLGAADKRALMRVLKAAAEQGSSSGSSATAAGVSSPPGLFADPQACFDSALREAGLGCELRSVVKHALALLGEEDTTVAKGVAAMQRYLWSLGRFTGAGALLVPLYGTSELPQAFCRTAAVAGATTVLRRRVDAVILAPVAPGDRAPPRLVTAVRTASGQILRCASLAAGGHYWDARCAPPPCTAVYRAACLVDSSLVDAKEQLLALLPPACLPCGGPIDTVRVLQYGPSACVTREDTRLLYFSTRCCESGADDALSPQEALWPSVCALLDTREEGAEVVEEEGARKRPRLRWAVFYRQSVHSEASLREAQAGLPSNAALCCGAGAEPHVCFAVEDARHAFHRLFPEAFFYAATAAEPAHSDNEQAEDALLGEAPRAGDRGGEFE